MAALDKLAEEILETLSQPLTTEKAKDCLISKVRVQFLSLKAQLQRTGNNCSDRPVQTQSVATQTEHFVSYSYNGTFVERPQEDNLGRWWVCACGRDSCPTCQAEKAAISTAATLPGWSTLKYNRSDGSCRSHTKPYQKALRVTFNLPEDKVTETPAGESDTPESPVPLYHFNPEDNPGTVKVISDPLNQVTGKCSWYMFQMHPAISSSSISGTRGSPFACGIIGLIFAHKITLSPFQFMVFTHPKSSTLTEGLYSMIKSSMLEGIQQYILNCRNEKEVELSAADTVLVTSHLGYRVHNEAQFDTMAEEMLIHYSASLECGQTLLFVRHKDYKVICIVCREFKGRKEAILFDPQYHDLPVPGGSRGERFTYGALLCYVLCEIPFLIQIVNQLQVYCGCLTGPCSIAVLDK